MPARMLWDLFCRVIDNYGDVGVCWRLAADLGARGHAVRLWLDDTTALTWMAPAGAAGVSVRLWDAAGAGPAACDPGDVVIEAFGCTLPEAFVARMAERTPAPAWINLEYLSAEPYVERSHRLASPVLAGPGQGLRKFFFYPGFTPATGGLLREPNLERRLADFDRGAWLADHGIAPRSDERLVSLFCYENPALPKLLQALADRPTLLLATAGIATRALEEAGVPSGMRVRRLPFLSQADFDALLWSCDINFVRGEDSLVRALWAGQPFVWQAYPQDDGAHQAKVQAFLDLFTLGDADSDELRRTWQAWNGMAPWPATLPDPADWQQMTAGWRQQLATRPDLTTQLEGFVRGMARNG